VDGDASFGVVTGERIVDLRSRLSERYETLRDVIAADALDEARRAADGQPGDHALADIVFLPVIPHPEKILAVALNYDDHIAETGRPKTENSAWFIRVPPSQCGHRQPLLMPSVSDNFDFEGELAAIIGTGGRAIPAASALNHVAGYSCYFDGSIRDWQRHTRQITSGKNFDRTGGFGPWMVTADEVPDPQALELTTRLNGKVEQHANTGQMVFSVAQLIEYCSTWTTLVPGDVIVTGTPGGVGFKRTPPLFMKVGDEVEVEIESIGTLQHVVGN
jgi:2-keto-4-pentenoate hydratase/2-oxohepta-3-ene-1,7-dioic acid hydratase in catechol pathway